jgi:hypothetical protein
MKIATCIIVLLFFNNCLAQKTNITCKDSMVVLFKKYNNNKNFTKTIWDTTVLNDNLYYKRKWNKKSISFTKLYNLGLYNTCNNSVHFFCYFHNILVAYYYYDLESLKNSYRLYYKNGKPRIDGFYTNGQKDKKWKYYNKDGTLEREEIWDMDKLINIH